MGACQSKKSILDSTRSDAAQNELSIFFVLGGPGSGKGTQCEKIAAQYGCKHISAGDLLRAEVAKGTALGEECKQIMTEGKLVPVEITLKLVHNAILESAAESFLIDGFPRTIEQASRFESEVASPKAVLFFECSQGTMMERILERGKTSGRADDTKETIEKRLKTFFESSAPVAEFYKAQGKCHRISAEENPDIVFQNTIAILDKYLQPTKQEETESTLTALDPQQSAISEQAKVSEQKLAFKTSPNGKAEVAAESSLNARVVFVLGGPGSGKGTQCVKIIAKFGCTHISVGDLLRSEVESGSELGKECSEIMKEGKLVPLSTTMTLLKQAVTAGQVDCYLVDGFPRSLEQAEKFEAEVKPCDCVLFFDCSESVMLERMIERSKSSGRADDNPETMKKRLETFTEISTPVVNYFKELGKCNVLSAERPADEIFADVCNVLTPLMVKEPVTQQEGESVRKQSALVVAQEMDGVFKEALVAALAAQNWTVEWRTWDDSDVEAQIESAQGVLWAPKESESNIIELLSKAKTKDVALLPKMEIWAKSQDAQFLNKVIGSEILATVEDGQKIEVQFAFDQPIEIYSYQTESEKEVQTVQSFQIDDPEFTPLLEKLMHQDLTKIQSALGTDESLPPFWSAVYSAPSLAKADKEDKAKQEFHFVGVDWTMPNLSKHHLLVETWIPKFLQLLSNSV